MIYLFDFGGVLVNLDKQRCITAFAEIGFDIRPYLGTYAQGGFFSEFERGIIDEAAFCHRIREASGHPGLTDRQITDAWRAYLTDVPAKRLDMLRRLHEREGDEVYILSNTNPVHWEQAVNGWFAQDGHKPSDYFAHAFLSYELGLEKPDAAIFEAVVRTLGCPPDDILFFDDCEENCEAARRSGLQSRLAPAGGAWLKYFTPEGDYRAE